MWRMVLHNFHTEWRPGWALHHLLEQGWSVANLENNVGIIIFYYSDKQQAHYGRFVKLKILHPLSNTSGRQQMEYMNFS